VTDDIPEAILVIRLNDGQVVRLACKDAVELSRHKEVWDAARIVMRVLGGNVVQAGPISHSCERQKNDGRRDGGRVEMATKTGDTGKHPLPDSAQAAFTFARKL
jgi:hypothetical protein